MTNTGNTIKLHRILKAPIERLYWQESLNKLAQLVEPEINE
jgi:hypothetical protein